MRTQKRNQGFTLVEVIVVAVIVAVLALVGIQLYTGYVQDARQNTAENLAASAAGYLATERNRESTITTGTVAGPGNIGVTPTGGNTATTFTVPANATLVISASSVSSTVGTSSSTGTYNW